MLVVVGRPFGSVTCVLLGALAPLAGPKRFVSDVPPPDCAPEGFELRLADPNDAAAVAASLAGATELVLLPRFERTTASLEVALAGAARAAGVRRITQISLIGADPRSPVELLRLFGAIERAVVASGLAYSIYRCAPFIQAIAHFLRRHPDRLELTGPFRSAAFAWINAADVGEIIAHHLRQPGDERTIIQLCGEEILDFDALAARLAAASGKPCDYRDLSPPAAHGLLEARGLAPAAARALIEYWDYIVSGVICTTPCDTARKLLGRPLKRVAESFPAPA